MLARPTPQATDFTNGERQPIMGTQVKLLLAASVRSHLHNRPATHAHTCLSLGFGGQGAGQVQRRTLETTLSFAQLVVMDADIILGPAAGVHACTEETCLAVPTSRHSCYECTKRCRGPHPACH